LPIAHSEPPGPGRVADGSLPTGRLAVTGLRGETGARRAGISLPLPGPGVPARLLPRERGPAPRSAHGQVALPPGQDVLEPGPAMLGPPGPAQFVTLAGEQQELGLHPAALEPDEPALALFDRAAPVVLGVDHQGRC